MSGNMPGQLVPPELLLEAFSQLDGQSWPRWASVGSCQPPAQVPWPNCLNVNPEKRSIAVLEGEMLVAWSDSGRLREHCLQPGDGIYLPPFAWFQMPWMTGCKFLGVVYRRGFLRCLVCDNQAAGGRVGPSWYHAGGDPDAVALSILHALDRLADTSPDPDLVSDLLRASWRLAAEHIRTRPASKGDNAGSWVQLEAFLHDRATEDLSRQDVATALDLHPNYLSTLCRERAGCGFTALRNRYRLEHAEHLLRYTKLSVSAIAHSSGFPDAGYFGRLFRRRYACSPGAFRRQYLASR